MKRNWLTYLLALFNIPTNIEPTEEIMLQRQREKYGLIFRVSIYSLLACGIWGYLSFWAWGLGLLKTWSMFITGPVLCAVGIAIAIPTSIFSAYKSIQLFRKEYT